MKYGTDSQPLTLGSGRGLLSSSYGKPWGGPPAELHEWGTAEAGRTSGPPEGQLGLVLILSGQMVVTVRDGDRLVKFTQPPGTLVLLSGDAPREVVRTEGCAQGLAIAVTDGWLPNSGELPERDWRELTTALPADPTALSLGLALRCEMESGAPNGPLFSEALALSLLNLTQARSIEGTRTHKLTVRECERVRAYVEEHLNGAISIDELAAVVGLRRRQFSACFRASFGISAYNYVVSRRVARGALSLARGESIAEAAISAGFCSQSHFTAAYRRQLGLTPSAGRRK